MNNAVVQILLDYIFFRDLFCSLTHRRGKCITILKKILALVVECNMKNFIKANWHNFLFCVKKYTNACIQLKRYFTMQATD